MKRVIVMVLLGVVFILGAVGCGPREYKTFTLADFCDEVESGDYATVSGVLKIPESILEFDRTYGLLLVEDLNQIQPYVRIGLSIGNRNNRMEAIPENFTMDDIKIRTNDGQIVTHGDTVSVSGFVGGHCIDGGNSDIKVSLIEAGP